MNYGEIKKCDIANGIGVRTTLFVSGCRNHCDGCFNKETWDFDYGMPFTQDVIDTIFEISDHEYVDGLTLLGGDPFEPENQRDLVDFMKQFKIRFPNKTIWVYTGYTLEQINHVGSHPNCEVTEEFLQLVDVLVDGRFIEKLHDVGLRFRGSSNQRIIDMNKTRETSSVTLWEDNLFPVN